MDITTKKIIVLLLLLPLIVFIGLSAYSMLNDSTLPMEKATNNQVASPTLETTSESDKVFTATIKGNYIFSDTTYSLDLRTKSTNNSGLSSEISDEIKWVFQSDEMSLTISTFIDESPFSTNADIEIVTLNKSQLDKPLFRFPIQDNYYFYSDSYAQQECGDKHCSNGLVSIPNSEWIEILCEIKKPDGLKLCDELVENFEIINVY